MKSIASAVTIFLLAITAAIAQGSPQEADHTALRKLKDDVLTAINNRNMAAVDAMLHKPFLSTVITQESFNETAKLRGWFEDLFARPLLRLRHFLIQADADEMAQIYTGTFAVARGSTKERYELADGRGFDFDGRWTATAIKDNGQWKVLALHSGANSLDNPVINAIERNTMTFAAVSTVLGAIVGFLLGFFIRRRQAKAA
jgi:ketosteroid isomerase-like protein